MTYEINSHLKKNTLIVENGRSKRFKRINISLSKYNIIMLD